MTPTITYNQLYHKLRVLGFEDKVIDWNGSERRLFNHPQHPEALIVLPNDREHEVAHLYLNAVRSVLLTHNLIDNNAYLLENGTA